MYKKFRKKYSLLLLTYHPATVKVVQVPVDMINQ